MPWNGLTIKPKWLYRAIKENYIPTKYLIFTDSWDLVFSVSPQEIIDTYKLFDCPIVISAEKNCFPGTYKQQFDELDLIAPYCYLNSGAIIGETEAILHCLEQMDLPNVPGDYFDVDKGQQINPEDQSMWQQTFLNQPVKISLDCDQLICQTLHDAKIEDFDFSEEKIKNNITGTYPCMWHFNGGAKDGPLREPILKHLGLL